MKKELTLKISLLLCVFLMGIRMNAHAQKDCDFTYEVRYSNCSQIMIGNQEAKPGMMFDELSQIKWAKDVKNQSLRVWNCKKCRCQTIVHNMEKKKWWLKWISEYETNTKGYSDTLVFDTIIFDTIINDTVVCGLDTLWIPAPSSNTNKIENKAIVYQGNDSITIAIFRSKDKKEYLIPRTALEKHDDNPFYIDIIEKDIEKNWQYAVWRKLYIVPLPLKTE